MSKGTIKNGQLKRELLNLILFVDEKVPHKYKVFILSAFLSYGTECENLAKQIASFKCLIAIECFNNLIDDCKPMMNEKKILYDFYLENIQLNLHIISV